MMMMVVVVVITVTVMVVMMMNISFSRRTLLHGISNLGYLEILFQLH
jgi:hypothetical protein